MRCARAASPPAAGGNSARPGRGRGRGRASQARRHAGIARPSGSSRPPSETEGPPRISGRRPQVDETVERTSDQVNRPACLPYGTGQTGLPERLTSLRKPCAAVIPSMAPLWRGAGIPWAWGQRHVRTASDAAYRVRPRDCKAEKHGRPDIFPGTIGTGRNLPRGGACPQAESPAGGLCGREFTGQDEAPIRHRQRHRPRRQGACRRPAGEGRRRGKAGQDGGLRWLGRRRGATAAPRLSG